MIIIGSEHNKKCTDFTGSKFFTGIIYDRNKINKHGSLSNGWKIPSVSYECTPHAGLS
jgi:hypothetical protein